MIRHGEAPFLECSSKGDKRFSAFNARVKFYDNKTIEEIYQASKVFKGGKTNRRWQEAKGRFAINQDDCAKFYTLLWRLYMVENPHLMTIIINASGLSDMFGQTNHVCQATELWNIRNEAIRMFDVPHI